MYSTKVIALLSFVSCMLVANGSPLLETPERSALLGGLLGGGSNIQCTSGTSPNWSYHEDCSAAANGRVPPALWGQVSAFCDGMRQSPIDIKTSILSTTCGASPIPSRSFQFDNGMCMSDSLKLKVDPKGWEVGFSECASPPMATIGGKQFKLLQFHLHSLSEHAFNGYLFDAELHLVHQDVTDPNNLVVIGVNLVKDTTNLFDLNLAGINLSLSVASGGEASAELKRYLDSLASKAGTRRELAHIPYQVMPYDMLPNRSDYFNYLGSLTTPPCNEIVTWVVMKEAITITKGNLDSFRDSLATVPQSIVSEDGNNNRPLQNINSRKVYSCTMV